MPATMMIVGLDVGSTTVKAVVIENDVVLWQHYTRRTNDRRLPFIFLVEMLGIMSQLHGQDGDNVLPARRPRLAGSA